MNGIDRGTAVLRIGCQAVGFGAYESPPIPVHVYSAEVRGIRLTSGTGWIYDLGGDPEAPIDVQAGWKEQLVVSLLDAQSLVIDPVRLGSGISIRATATPAGVVEATLDVNDDWTLRLDALEAGATSIRLELLRDGIVVHESGELHVRVRDEIWQAWFRPENAPNGQVTGLVAFGEQLIVTGDFSAIGAMPSPGIAAWDGSGWVAMAVVPIGTQRVQVDNGTLYATGAESGFYRWDGDGWEFLLDAPDGSEDALMFGGDPVALVTTSRAYRLAWRWADDEWTSMGSTSRTHYSFYYRLLTPGPRQLWAWGTLTRPGTCPDDDFVDVYDGESWEPGHELPCMPCDLCGSWVEFLAVVGNDVVMDWGAGSTWGSGRGVTVRRDGVWTDTFRTPSRLRGAGRLGDDLALATKNMVYLLENGSDLREIGLTDRDGIEVAASFQGAVYLGGAFGAVDGVPSTNIAVVVAEGP
ncbi:MAG: hypothetical protein R3E97_16835 [Candidatus Eisenbacteria bacterium]